MTTAPPSSPAADAILRATGRSALNTVPTASALAAAAALLDDLWATGARHGVDAGDLDLGWAAVNALTEAYRRQQPQDVDPAALVDTAARAAAQELGLDLADLVAEGPVSVAPERAYVVLARQPQTPPWGPYGNAPLVLRLDREDYGSGRLGPWAWVLFPDVNAGVGPVSTVIAPPPTLEVAAEVGQIAARVLSGKAATGV